MTPARLSTELLLRLVSEAAHGRHEAERHFRTTVVTARAGGVTLPRIAQAGGLSVSRIHGILGEEQELMTGLSPEVRPPRPATAEDDVLVVPAGKLAFTDYLTYNAYVCQPERSFRDTERLGFYREGQIEPLFPRVRYRRMNVEFSHANVSALRSTGAALDAELADVIDGILNAPNNGGHKGGSHQIFLLTPPDDPQTLRLERPIVHRALGRGTAWVQGQRYTSEDKLRRNPRTTDDLR